MARFLLIILALLLAIPNFIRKDINPTLSFNHLEKYDPALGYITSIQLLEQHVDSLAAQQKVATNSYQYVWLVANAVKYRFYHGFSHFSLNENWIAALAGKLIKEDHACKVQPNAIMQHPNAACSQQEIVMMAVLRDKHINYRPVFFPHHYALEVFTENQWYYFDPNMEPAITRQERALPYWQHHSDSLKRHYDTLRFNDLDFKFGKGATAQTGTINEIPAPRARLFHQITRVLSYTAWIIPLLFALFWPSIQKRFPSKKA